MGAHVSLMTSNTWTRIHRDKQIHGDSIPFPTTRMMLLSRDVPHFDCTCSVISKWMYNSVQHGVERAVQGISIMLGSEQGTLRVFQAADDSISDDQARTGSCEWKTSGGNPPLGLRITMNGHTGRINAASTGLDGNIGATCSDDKKILIWDLKNDKIVHTLKGHAALIKCCELSSDGDMLISGDRDGKMILWDVRKGVRIGRFGKIKPISESEAKSMSIAALRALEYEHSQMMNHSDAVKCCSFDKNQPFTKALSGSWDMSLLVWDLSTLKSVTRLKGHTDRVTGCSLASSSNIAVSCSLDKVVRIWDLRTGSQTASLVGHEAEINSIGLSSSPLLAPLLVSGSTDGKLKIWDLRKMKERETLWGHNDAVLNCSIIENGEFICSVGRDGFARVWKVRQLIDIPLSIFIGQRGEEEEMVQPLRIDEKDDVYCAKEQFRILSLKQNLEGHYTIPDENYRDLEPGRQKWTCTVNNRKKMLDVYKDKSSFEEMGIPEGTSVRLHPPMEREAYLKQMEAEKQRKAGKAHSPLAQNSQQEADEKHNSFLDG